MKNVGGSSVEVAKAIVTDLDLEEALQPRVELYGVAEAWEALYRQASAPPKTLNSKTWRDSPQCIHRSNFMALPRPGGAVLACITYTRPKIVAGTEDA